MNGTLVCDGPDTTYDPCSDPECQYLVSVGGYPATDIVSTFKLNGSEPIQKCPSSVTGYPGPIYVGAMFLFKGNIFYCLGKDEHKVSSNQCRMYNSTTGVWNNSLNLSIPNSHVTVIRKDFDTVLIMGGKKKTYGKLHTFFQHSISKCPVNV